MPPPHTERQEGEEETPWGTTQGAPSVSPGRPRPSEGGGGLEAEGEVQGAQVSKKLRRREEESEAQREGQSLKVRLMAPNMSVSLKTLPTAPQTNPYRCHKSRLKYTSYLDTSNTLGEGP